MKPYYEDTKSGIQIFLGDCRDILPHLPKVDLVLTDPPYGLGARMQGGTWGSAEKYTDLRSWDVRPAQDVLESILCRSWTAIIWGGIYYTLPVSRCWLVWDKRNAVHTMADCELAWTNFERPVKRFSWPVGIHHFGHPTEKPIELFSWCLAFVPNAQTVLDPFMGSGTTLRAAKDLGRHAIGIEIEEKYCEIAAKRLAQEVLQL